MPAAVASERARAAADGAPADPHADASAKQADAHARTEALEWRVDRLRNLLVEISPVTFDFEAVRRDSSPPVFDPDGLDVEEPAPEPHLPEEPGGLLGKVRPSARARYEEDLSQAREQHRAALAEHAEREERRRRLLADAMAAFERERSDVESQAAAHNREIDAVRARLEAGDPDVLVQYFAAVLAASDYPDGFPRRATVALDDQNRILVVDYELPGLDAVPAVQAYRYDVSMDAFEEVPRPSARRKDLYALVVASVALRSVAELFEADRTRALDSIGFNGYVHGVDRATGEAVRPYLVSVRTTREELRQADMMRTDPIVTVRQIDAAFSTNPAELAPVRQVVGAKAVGSAHLATSPEV